MKVIKAAGGPGSFAYFKRERVGGGGGGEGEVRSFPSGSCHHQLNAQER